MSVRAAIPATCWQFARFAVVGASGYVVNLATFALVFHLAGVGYRVAATVAFLVSVSSNFLWNRRWTFDVRHGQRGAQAARFLAVSVVAFGFGLGVLSLLVDGAGLPEVPAQAIAVVAAMPLNFAGTRLWVFRR